MTNWRDDEQRFLQYQQYNIYYENAGKIDVRDTKDGLSIKNADSFYDQVIDTCSVDVKDFCAELLIEHQPKPGNKIYFGITSSYRNADGTKKHIQMNRGQGEFVAITVVAEFLRKDKLEISFYGNTKNPNHGGYKYFGKYDGYHVKQFISNTGDFVGHCLNFSLRWDGLQFVIGVSDGQSFTKNNLLMYEDCVFETSVPHIGWNAIVLEDYADSQGYFFVNPGEDTQLILRKNKIKKSLNNPAKYLGYCEDFWSCLPVPLTSTSLPFQKFPDYLYDKDCITSDIFKTKDLVLPFAHTVNIVRFLGGWNPEGATPYGKNLGLDRVKEFDLAYREMDGTIAYRFGEGVADDHNLIKQRLDPFVRAGVSKIRIVLDNTPYCFPEEYYVGDVYGQSALAKSITEWDEFIRAVLREIVRLYGEKEELQWSFRLATEGDDYGRFSGNLKEYCKMYEVISKAIFDIIPQATFGPYNVLNDYNHLYEVIKFAKEKKLKMDYLSASIYVEHEKNPDASLEWVGPNLNKLRACAGDEKNIPFEIHEFDLISLRGGGFQKLPGARGAAAMFRIMMNLREQGVNGMFHWGILENITTSMGRYTLPESRFWLLSVLNNTIDTDMYRLSYKTAFDDDPDAFITAIGFFDKEKQRNTVIVSAYHLDPGAEWKQNPQVCIPKEIIGSIPQETSVQELKLCNESDWCYHVRKDLEKEDKIVELWKEKNLILKGYKNKSILSQLCDDDERGLEIFDENYTKYETIIKNCYQWKAGQVKIELDNEQCYITMEVENPTIYVLTW